MRLDESSKLQEDDQALAYVSDAVIRCDADWRVEWANPAAQGFFGAWPAEGGEPTALITMFDDPAAFSRIVAAAAGARDGAEVEALRLGLSGRAGSPSEIVVRLLVHVGQADVANRIRNAWLRTLEDGVATADIFRDSSRQRRATTAQFADAVIARLGQEPRHLPKAMAQSAAGTVDKPVVAAALTPTPASRPEKILEGSDLFVHWDEPGRSAGQLAQRVRAALPASLQLKMITNRGVMVWPEGHPETFCTDHWRCRVMAAAGHVITAHEIPVAMTALTQTGLDVIKTENLYRFNGQPGYSLGQGE